MTLTDSLTLACPYCPEFHRTGEVPCGQHVPPAQTASWYEELALHIQRRHIGVGGNLVRSSKKPRCLHQTSGRQS